MSTRRRAAGVVKALASVEDWGAPHVMAAKHRSSFKNSVFLGEPKPTTPGPPYGPGGPHQGARLVRFDDRRPPLEITGVGPVLAMPPGGLTGTAANVLHSFASSPSTPHRIYPMRRHRH